MLPFVVRLATDARSSFVEPLQHLAVSDGSTVGEAAAPYSVSR
jgi:hypothetical protein